MTRQTYFKIALCGLFALRLAAAAAQQSTHAAGGEAAGAGGTVSYSVGQVVFTAVDQGGGSVSQGVQQPYEFFSVSAAAPPGIALRCSVYPNPTAAGVTLAVDPGHWPVLTVRLLDAEGRLLSEQQTGGAQTAIPMETLPSAVYFLQITHNRQIIQTFKIIKNQ